MAVGYGSRQRGRRFSNPLAVLLLKRFSKQLKRSFSGRFSRLGIAQVNLALHSAYRKRSGYAASYSFQSGGKLGLMNSE
jgi:hypothetical protein